MKLKLKLKPVFIAFSIILLILYGVSHYDRNKDANANTTIEEYMRFTNFNPKAELGTEENPFIVLEIVPYRGMGQFGYIVGGQEPVDISLSTYEKPLWGPINAFAYSAFSPVKKDVLNSEDMSVPYWTNRWSWISETKNNQTGYFIKVTDKTGLYDKVVAGSTTKFTKNKEGIGDYNWVPAANTKNIPTDYNADMVWMTNYKLEVSYWKPSNDWKFKNTEIFKRQVLLIPDDQIDNYHVRVVTITPSELNKNVEKFSKYYDLSQNGINNKVLSGPNTNGEIDLIGNADLISISPKAHAGANAVVDLWEQYGRDKSGKTTSSGRYNAKFADNDISWQTAMELFMKIGVVEDDAALIYDITNITSPQDTSKSVNGPVLPNEKANGYMQNIYKLCLLLRQRDPVETYNLYMNTNGGSVIPDIWVTTVNGKTTGSYNVSSLNSDSKVYWGEYTFLPYYPDGTAPGWLSQDQYKSYLLKNDILVSWIAGSAHSSVIRNTYTYNGDSSVVQNFVTAYNVSDNTYTPYDYNDGLFDYIQAKTGSRPATTTPCSATEYILKVQKSYSNTKAIINILDLEPSNDFTLTVNYIRNMIPTYTGVIRIEQQTTAEFIGKIEDLNSTYDLIFIGTKTGKMNTTNGKTIYNDPIMDGLIYTHVGDRVVAYDNFHGILKNGSETIKALDSIELNNGKVKVEDKIFKSSSNGNLHKHWKIIDFYRYPGNDITSIKKEELQQFINAGYPILLENDLYNRNTYILDDSSYLYQILNENKDNTSLFNKNQVSDVSSQYDALRERLSYLISREKLTLNIVASPVPFDVNNEDTLLENRTLTYQFIINPPTESQINDLYQWKLYVDANADGRFVDKERIASDKSKAGEFISVTKNLSEKYAGVIPWKLEVYKVDNSNIRTEQIGYAAFKVQMSQTEKLKTQINVLQITSNTSTLNLQELMNPAPGKTSLFYKYTSNLDDFNVNITTINVNTFLNKYKGAGNAYDVNRPEETDKLCYLENDEKKSYDMIIFGFGDCYSDINNDNGALNNIQAFIDSGKSVMFTHDTTSFINQKSSDFDYGSKGLTYWGYGFNQYLRNRVGLDRFGVMKEAGDTTPYDVATMPSKVDRDLIYEEGVTTYPEIQGLTYGILVAFGNPGSNALSDLFKANKDYPPFSSGNAIVQGSAINNYHSNFVTKVNEGQVTNYPYDIPDSFNISTTHTQYYQVNMDDPEVVVWFCLSDNKAKEYGSNASNVNYNYTNETGPYSSSPNDVRNNYYIYSKGNIMYTGVGHSSIDKLENEGSITTQNEYEVQLFINTMIASYNAGVTAPTVEITNEDAIANGSNEYIMYEDLDNVIPATDAVKRIKFKAEDTNVLSEDLVARIYYYNTAGDLVLANPTIISISGSTPTAFSSPGMETGYYVKNGKEYYFDLPLNTFYTTGSDRVYITVTNEENVKGGIKGVLVGRSLFDLD